MAFEKLKVSQLLFVNRAVMPMYAAGRTTGLSFGSGHGLSYALPVFEGVIFKHCLKTSELAGNAVD